MVEGFLLGVIATASLTAGLFFVRFWRETRDSLFLLFAVFFIVEAINRTGYLLLERPNEGHPAIYLIRLVGFTMIVVAIIRKNYGPDR
jgi:uncharacterized membrane protein HdeD (DUF308 family)